MMHAGIAYLRWRGKRSRHSRCMRTRNFAYLARGPWLECTWMLQFRSGRSLQCFETSVLFARHQLREKMTFVTSCRSIVVMQFKRTFDRWSCGDVKMPCQNRPSLAKPTIDNCSTVAEIYYSIYTDHDDWVGNQTIFTTTRWPHALACNVLLRKQCIMRDSPGPRGVLDDQGRF